MNGLKWCALPLLPFSADPLRGNGMCVRSRPALAPSAELRLSPVSPWQRGSSADPEKEARNGTHGTISITSR